MAVQSAAKLVVLVDPLVDHGAAGSSRDGSFGVAKLTQVTVNLVVLV